MDLLDVLDLEIPFPERGRVDPIAENWPIPDPSADALHGLDREAQAVLVRSAPTILALIVERREELPRQVAVRQVKLDAVDAGRDRTRGGALEALEDMLDLVLLELLRNRPAGVLAGGHLARRQHVGGVLVGVDRGIGLEERYGPAQSDMQQLHHDRAAVPLHRARHPGEPRDLPVAPKARKADGRVERVLVDQMPAQNDHSQAGFGALLVVGLGLVGEDPFMRILDPGRAGRGEDDPVRDGGTADP